MRALVASLLGCLLFACGGGEPVEEGELDIYNEGILEYQRRFELGRIESPERFPVTIPVRNITEETVEIVNVSLSCGCTHVISRPESLGPGEEGAIVVEADPLYRGGGAGFARIIPVVARGEERLPLMPIRVTYEYVGAAPASPEPA